MTNFKNLCVDLVDALTAHGQPDDAAVGYVAGLLTRARAALAEPEPEEPTDDDLWDIGERHLWTGTDESVTNYRILISFITAARAALARWGK